MGDVLSLIEKAQETLDEKKAAELEKKIRKNRFTLQDFYDQIQETKKMGSVGDILGKLPGLSGKVDESQLDNHMFDKTEAIILSMTKKEREDVNLLNASRKRRIAKGSGTTVADINTLLKQFQVMQSLTKQMSRGKMPRGAARSAGRRRYGYERHERHGCRKRRFWNGRTQRRPPAQEQ